jgi:DNA-3-methyladenine glycosylase
MGNLLIKSSKKSSVPAELKSLIAGSAPRVRALDAEFYRQNTLKVAQELLGRVLVVRAGSQWAAGRIVETEAYREGDPACHAWLRKTPRNAIMFGEPGRVYVYFIYGMYEMLNLVTEPKGKPAAVLIRALEPLFGIEAMKERRPKIRADRDLANGPGRLARAMGVKLEHKGEKAFGPNYFVFDDGYQVESISSSPRVGISKGTELDWRYFITDHPCLSKAPENKKSRVIEECRV